MRLCLIWIKQRNIKKNHKKYLNKDYKYSSKREIILSGHSLSVIENNHKSLGETLLDYKGYDSSEYSQWDGWKIGDYVWKDYFDEINLPSKYNKEKNRFLVKEILNQKIERDGGDFGFAEINQKLKVEVVEFDSKRNQFESFEKLWEAYPEYHPERIYNFNQEKGFLYPHGALARTRENPSFTWIKKGDRYFLNFNDFSKIISANSYFGNGDWKYFGQENKSGYSLTDVVLTSEAIRRRNWGKLRYNAFFGNNRNFTYKNEKTWKRYEQAILDTGLSLKADKEGWSNSDFLRKHLFDNLSRTKVPHEKILEGLKKENKQVGINRRKATLERKKKKENEEQELPF